jgi:hypothetical protein
MYGSSSQLLFFVSLLQRRIVWTSDVSVWQQRVVIYISQQLVVKPLEQQR